MINQNILLNEMTKYSAVPKVMQQDGGK